MAFQKQELNMTESLAGYSGESAEVEIPARSFRLITNAVFDSDSLHANLNREVSFRAIRTTNDVNISEVFVHTHTVDGRQVDREVRVVYRNGLFKSAKVRSFGEEMDVNRLSDALAHIFLAEGN